MIAWLLTLALAQDAAPVDDRPPEIPADATLLPEPTVDEGEAEPVRADGQPEFLEIVVVSPLAVSAARDAVIRAMTKVGWKSKRRRDGTVLFRGPEGWMGKAVLTGNGELEFNQPVLAFGGIKETEGNYDASRSSLNGYQGGGTVGISTVPLPNKAIVLRAQQEIAEAVRDDVIAYRLTLQQRYFSAYVTDLPVRLDALWERGESLDGGPVVTEPAKRRAAVLEFWSSRTDTPEGRTVSRTLENWLRGVVMDSPHPVTPEEAAAAESRRVDGRKLDLF